MRSSKKHPPINQLDFFSAAKADEIKNVKIYRSSAGSGKTFTLVKECLKILIMDPNQYKHLLAITFTNEATREMRKRIISELGKIGEGKQTYYMKNISDELSGMQIPYRKRANKVLKNILHNYSRFEVSTIDHFFSRLVRSLAWELKLPIKYDIDVDNEQAMDYAVDAMFDTIHENQIILRWLEDFAFNLVEENKGWNIEYNLHKLGMELFSEKLHHHFSGSTISIEELANLVSQLNMTCTSFEKTLKELAREAVRIIKDAGLEARDFKGGSKSVAKIFHDILKGSFNLTATFMKVANGEDNWYAQKSLKKEKIKQVAANGLDNVAREIFEEHQRLYQNYVSAKALLKNIFSYGLLEALNAQLKTYRSENNLMLMSDMGFMLKEMISDHEAPFLFEKAGSRYLHLVIDEFQDTSDYQWHNLRPLVLNSVGSQHKVFIAGDVKQSIYRWRGGNMQLLISGVQNDLGSFSDQITEEALYINWRSAPEIVSFNNSFFSIAREIMSRHPDLPENGRQLVHSAYQHVKQKASKTDRGYVEVTFYDRKNEQYRSWQEMAKDDLLCRIGESIKDGFAYSDIMILVDLGYQANELAEFLSSLGIPVLTESSLLVHNSRIVQLLIAALEWLRDEDNKIAHANLIYNYLTLCGKKPDLHTVFSDPNLPEDNMLKEVLPESFWKNRDILARKTVYDLVEELVILFDLQERTDGFLQRFQDICLEQSAKGNNDIHSFLEWWEEKQQRNDRNSMRELSIVTPAGSNAVKIMTIHKAKGLESPIVFVPFAGEKFDLKEKSNSTFWTDNLPEQYKKFKVLPLSFDKQLKESHFEEAYRNEYLEVMIEKLNVVYVAFTRARQRLYIFSVKSKTKTDEINSLHKLLRAVFDHNKFPLKEHWDEKSWRFTLGECLRTRKEPEQRSPNLMEGYPTADYADKVKIRPQAQFFFQLLDNETSAKIKEGIQVHKVLEKLTSLKELDRVIYTSVQEGIINKKHSGEIKNMLGQLFSDERMQDWFSGNWESITEREIISEGKKYRPDRVMLKNGEAVIIDYKREKEEPKHKKQIGHYRNLLKRMGHEKITCYLLYILEKKVVEVA